MSTNNINVGNNSQNVIGDGNTVSNTMNNGGVAATFEQFIQAMREAIPPEQLESVQAEVLNPLTDIAAEPEPTNEQDRITLKARIATLLSQLEPYSPYIRKTVAAFAEGALSAIPPPASWIVAGCIEVVRDARRD